MTSFADAQENLDLGKSGAQLCFTSGFALFIKTPQGLTRSGGVFGLGKSFLREHYTASRGSAAAIAAYVKAQDTGPAARQTCGETQCQGDGKSDKPEENPKVSPKGKATARKTRRGKIA